MTSVLSRIIPFFLCLYESFFFLTVFINPDYCFVFLENSKSCHVRLQLLMPIFFTSSSTDSSHLNLGLSYMSGLLWLFLLHPNVMLCVQKLRYICIHTLIFIYLFIYFIFRSMGRWSGFGGLEVACWPLVPKFAGFTPGRSRRIFRVKKSSVRLPPEGK